MKIFFLTIVLIRTIIVLQLYLLKISESEENNIREFPGKDPFSQLRNVINLMEHRVQKLAEAYHVEQLAGPQGFAVMFLKDNPDKDIFIKDIEQNLKISKSVTSDLIRRMEKNGFIQVCPAQRDKRYKRVILTDLGREKAQAIADFHLDIRQQILAGIRREDLTIAFRVFEDILQNLEKKE